MCKIQTDPNGYRPFVEVKMKAENTKAERGFSRKQAQLENSLAAEDLSSNSIWFSKRFFVAIMIFLCSTNYTMLTNNLNIAIVEMTSNKIIVVDENNTMFRPAELQWDTITIGIVSSAFWYGGLISFLSGYCVDKIGGSVTCALVTAISGILTILHPAALRSSYSSFLLCRFLTGFFANSVFVSVPEIYSRWFPKKERSVLTAIGYSGVNAGTAISFPLFGYIAEEWNWQMVFYFSGLISILLSLLCLIVVKNRPSEDDRISDEELSYILHGTDDASRKEEPHPYMKILSSGPVLAVCAGKFTLLWLSVVFSQSLPLYIKDLTGKSTEEIGIISSIPTVVQIFTIPIAGVLLDAWNNTGTIKLTQMHKTAVCLAFSTSSICLLFAVFYNDFTTSIVIIVLIHIVLSVAPPVFEPIIVNISPNDSSVIGGLAKFVSSTGMAIARTSVGYMTVNHSSHEWNNCFLLAAGVLVIGAVIFMTFASSEAQPWSSLSIFQQEQRPLIKIKYRGKSFNTCEDRLSKKMAY